MLRHHTALIEMTPPKTSLALTLGSALRAIRKAQGKTLKQVADAMNTSPQTVQRLETGTMTISAEWIEKFCATLGIDPGELFDADDVLGTKANELTEQRRHLRARARTLQAEATNFIEALQAFLDRTDDEGEEDDQAEDE